MDPIGRPNNWSVIVLCALLLLFTLLLTSFRNKLYLTLRALYSQRFYTQLLREGKIMHERVAIFTLLFDLMTLSFGALVCMERFTPKVVEAFSYIGMYGITLAVMTVLFLLKMLVNHIYTHPGRGEQGQRRLGASHTGNHRPAGRVENHRLCPTEDEREDF